ncbi:MAG: SNF2 helicase associated domain-containing protein, partial [Defluviitaleaceae bacterium]|nr:SNF2 helicase associated domain-containing protein [Defluviitaleaceae bacterium]
MPPITKGAILNLSSNTDVYERGERYYRAGKLLSFTAEEETGETTVVRASVEGNYKNYDVTIRLDSANAPSAYACSCESHSIWRGACKHVVAALFALSEDKTRSFSSEKMNIHAKRLADSLEKIIYDGIDSELSVFQSAQNFEKSMLRLAPVINCRNKGVFLTFTIGRGRMYVVKNISGFVKSCKKGETVSYGQGLTFSHRREMFDETSQKLVDFITREDDMYAEIAKRLSHRFQFVHKPLYGTRELFLTPRNTDEFFDLFSGETLECVSDFAQFVTLQDGCPNSVVVRHTDDGTVLQLSCEHFFFAGATFYYLLSADGFFRMPKADGRLLKTLFKTLSETPSQEVLFSGDEQNRFVTVVLPRLLKMGAVESVEGECPTGKISTLRTIKIFLDTDKKDITARVEFDYGEDADVFRDVIAEYEIYRRLTAHGFFEDKKIYRLKGQGSSAVGNELLFAFLHEPFGMESLRDVAEIFVSEDLQKKASRPGVPKLGLRLSGNLLNISLEDSEYEIGELIEALEAYRNQKKFFRLRDGRFISLESEEAGAAAEFLNALDVSKKELNGDALALPAYRALYAGDISSSLSHTRDENFKKLLENFGRNADFEIPSGLEKILREYQKTGFRWLKTLAHYGFGGILADDMGLGKTLQIITLIASGAPGESKQKPAIVVAPTSVLYNWENEIAKFAPQLKSLVVSGVAEKRHELLKTDDIDVFITTYDMLKRDVPFYRDMEFSYVVADEAQNIKNPATKAAKSLKSLNGRVRFALTGTPIENTLSELWSIFDFIMPGYLFGASRFSRIYEIPILKGDDKNAAEKLRKQIAPFVLRRIKKNVLRELPEKTETTLPADFEPEQKKIYRAYHMKAMGVLDEMIGS